jgi:DNA invertase Pin-like site-specific DNA recombinase
MVKIVAYFRVSTKRQGQSGLGLDAQRAAVLDYSRANGCELVAEFTEIESGKLAERPVLVRALAQARRGRCKLVIAKLDRLARNVAFLSALMEAGVEFVACDNPTANRLTIHILAAVAEDEARRISARTKAALAAAKARGTMLGSARAGHWSGREARRLAGAKLGNKRSADVRRARALQAVDDLADDIRRRRAAGETLKMIAGALNDAGQRTTGGTLWTPTAVKRVIDRLSAMGALS